MENYCYCVNEKTCHRLSNNSHIIGTPCDIGEKGDLLKS